MKTTKLCLLLFVYLLTTSMCKKDEKVQAQIPSESPYYRTMKLSKISDNPDYLQLPLEGVTWKFVGYVDEEAQQIQLMTRCSDASIPTCYTAVFGQGEIFIRTENELYYKYEVIDSAKNLKIEFTGGTKILEGLTGLDRENALKV